MAGGPGAFTSPIPAAATAAQESAAAAEAKPRMDIYGFAMLDMGYQTASKNHPDWFDVIRPTKLPEYKDQWGKDGNTYAGVRQSRARRRELPPTALGELKTIFEFEMFGVGADAGQTTIRLRHAWGELGPDGAGQSWSPFMDPTCFRTPSSTGARRDGLLPQRPAALDAVAEGDSTLRDRARAAESLHRPGRLRGPHRACRRQRPVPAAGPLRRSFATRRTGSTSRSPGSSAR